MKAIEAVVLDATHLKLKMPLTEAAGQRLLIHVVPFREEQERLVRELQAAYLAMSEEEREAEVTLEDEWPWWE